MNRSWRSECWLLLGLIGAAALVGALFGRPWIGVCAGLALCLAWYLYQTITLNRWLAGKSDPDRLPDARGLWSELYHRQRLLAERHRSELAELNSTLDRYRRTTRALPEATVTLSEKGEIEFINHAATRLLGLKDPQDLGRPITNLLREPEFVAYFEQRDFREALEVSSPDNETLTLSIRVVPYGEGNKMLLLARDVSRLHRLEEVRRDFIANVSHELKSPLTVIKGYVESLLDAPETKGGRWERPLTQIDQQTDRMVRIVQDLLVLSNLETSDAVEAPARVDVPSLIASICTEGATMSRDRHRFVVDVDQSLFLRGSFNELYSAFSNLVFNAVRYTPDGGTVEIGWHLNADGEAVFSVRDNGVGIGAAHIPRLTERFYRVDQGRSRELGGTGLGLAIVKHVLLRHDALLRVTSELGEGSLFECVFAASRVAPRLALRNSA